MRAPRLSQKKMLSDRKPAVAPFAKEGSAPCFSATTLLGEPKKRQAPNLPMIIFAACKSKLHQAGEALLLCALAPLQGSLVGAVCSNNARAAASLAARRLHLKKAPLIGFSRMLPKGAFGPSKSLHDDGGSALNPGAWVSHNERMMKGSSIDFKFLFRGFPAVSL